MKSLTLNLAILMIVDSPAAFANLITYAQAGDVIDRSLPIATAAVPGLRATAEAEYGFVDAHADAWQTGGYSSSTARFDDFLTILGTGQGFVSATVEVNCCWLYEGEGHGAFDIGFAHVTLYPTITAQILLTPITFGSPFEIRAAVDATATEDLGGGTELGYANVRPATLVARAGPGHPRS